jgi:hypothetical protein
MAMAMALPSQRVLSVPLGQRRKLMQVLVLLMVQGKGNWCQALSSTPWEPREQKANAHFPAAQLEAPQASPHPSLEQELLLVPDSEAAECPSWQDLASSVEHQWKAHFAALHAAGVAENHAWPC